MKDKFYVPFQIAEMLKDKGYPQESDSFQECDMYYYDDGELEAGIAVDTDDLEDCICAPTYHEVLDWFEEKGITIESAKRWTKNYCYAWSSDIIRRDNLIKTCIGETREKAFNEAIIYALTII